MPIRIFSPVSNFGDQSLIFKAVNFWGFWGPAKMIVKKTRSFCSFPSNSEVKATWVSLVGWPHNTSNTYFGTMKKKHKNAFLACFRAYVRQPHSHTRWATSMPFASINPTNPRSNRLNFLEIFLRIADFEKLSFFESAILIFFFQFFFNFFFFFASIPWKSVQIYMVE